MRTDLAFINDLSKKFGPTQISISQFFLSNNSVIALAYSAFSRTLIELKSYVDDEFKGSINSENPSSKWPKTTLGCLTSDKSLSESEVNVLRDLCTNYSNRIISLEELDLIQKINSLQLVVFGCRSLENKLFSLTIPLNGDKYADDTPPPLHSQFVKEVISQFSKENHDLYFPKLNPNGRTINSHYRNFHVETTLIAEITLPERVKEIVFAFRNAVDKSFPDVYQWFDESSWHLTLRALVSK
ncbi:MAG TPA: hypothetical protein PKN44_11690 [Bacteroidales bacterium]|mgnify:CR=1 FL=1|nr:hypothetical protein [Bacteroidales bacterium]